ncbi:MAG: prephenate dehydratase [Clostridia bacterium]|nr:prephenate dehydratase [Clostridia bacterium]
MNELEKLRCEIDEIDSQLLPLFLKRMECSKKVADYKKKNSLPVLDKARENEILNEKAASVSPDKASFVRAFFSSIMSISRKAQRQLLSDNNLKNSLFEGFDQCGLKTNPTVVFQGVAGANSETALMKIFGNDTNRINVMTFAETLDSLQEEKADYAVLPFENSSTGSISGVFDLLENRDLYIVSEVDVSITHCLVAPKGATLDTIRQIYSHEQGYLQCKEFFKNYPKMKFSAYHNTALAAKYVAGLNDASIAAIADKRTAEIYGLEVLAENISTNQNNVTRFVAIAKRGIMNEKCNKISVILTLPNESGALCQILSEFKNSGLNLVKIESRPLCDKNFEYMFFIDFEGNLLDKDVQNVISAIQESTTSLKILGNYHTVGSLSERQ